MPIQVLTSTMDSHKETHRNAFELVKTASSMQVDRAEKQALKLRTNKKFS